MKSFGFFRTFVVSSGKCGGVSFYSTVDESAEHMLCCVEVNIHRKRRSSPVNVNNYDDE